MCTNKQSLRSGNRLCVKRSNSLFRMDIHKSVNCLDGDGEIRSHWIMRFDLIHTFEVFPRALIELDA